jgi:hypothetical protein
MQILYLNRVLQIELHLGVSCAGDPVSIFLPNVGSLLSIANQGLTIHGIYGSDGVEHVSLSGYYMKKISALTPQLCPSNLRIFPLRMALKIFS